MRLRLALCLVAVASVLFAASAQAESFMYWGGTIKGAVYGKSTDAPLDRTVLERFEADAGKKVTFINVGENWATFDAASLEATVAEGAIPLVTMGLPQGVTLAEVAEGKQDAQIRAWARAAKAFGYPFLFRPWWEMNGGWYSWGRNPEFVAAWRHFHELVEEEGATNVTWAWVVDAIWADPASDPTPYYPGDEFVDWVGMDAYNWGQNSLQPDKWRDPEEVMQPTIELLGRIAPGKPICVCEDASTEIGGDKAAWITEMLGTYLPAHPEIKAYLWFNWNVDQTGAVGEWDWPIESSPTAEAAFRAGIQSALYLPATAPPTKLTKVPMPSPPPLPALATTPPATPPAPAAESTSPATAGPSASSRVEARRAASPRCVVPNLRRRRLEAAKKTIRASGCKVGKVTRRNGPAAAAGTVVGQNRKPGTVVPAGTVVAVRLGVG
jgi:Glycosyl hydrolase family 26/PASTA domain